MKPFFRVIMKPVDKYPVDNLWAAFGHNFASRLVLELADQCSAVGLPRNPTDIAT